MAQMPLNGHLREEGKVTVSRDAVIQVHKRLNPKVTSIKAGKQGSSDEKSAWARARFNWLTQLLIRFGGSLNEVDLEKLKVDGALSDCFNIAKMSSLSLAQVAFWDEKCQIGGIGASSKKEETRYPRDKNGNVDPNDEYNPEQKSVLQVKFEAEIRLCLGIATEIKKETTVDGPVTAVEIGKRLNPYI